jgi:hypothetical protein
VDYNRAFLTPAFTTTSINIVGEPTFPFLHAIGRSPERPASEGSPYTSFELSTLNRFSPLTPIIPVHTRGSPVSPIIPVHTQKQGGGAFPPNVFAYNSFVFFHHVNESVKLNCRRADNFILVRDGNVARATVRRGDRGVFGLGSRLCRT